MSLLHFWELEEHVGQLWDRLITRAASKRYPEAAVHLHDIKKTLGIMFRAMIGDAAMHIETSIATQSATRRNWIQRVAGSEEKIQLCWLDTNALHLPETLDVFPQSALNKKLYIWLTALASSDNGGIYPWYQRNQQLTIQTLHRFPGLKPVYEQLVTAHIANRPELQTLPADEAQQEIAIRQALHNPGQAQILPPARRPPEPVYLWLHPYPPENNAPQSRQDTGSAETENETVKDSREIAGKKQAKREDNKKTEGGLLAIRFENIFSWSEFINLDRSQDEENDMDEAAAAMQDMDTVSLAKNSESMASKLKVDLDLPAEAYDDLKLGQGIYLPEWDYKKQILKKDYCCLQPMLARDANAHELPAHLKFPARKLRNQFEALKPMRIWFKAQEDGTDIDMDAYLQFHVQQHTEHRDTESRLYKSMKNSHRDLSSLLLADLSLSTDSWINNTARTIDVIRDSLYLFAESLTATGDQFAIHGFSSRNRNHVRFNIIKNFEDTYNAGVRGRIQAIKPGFYTRMGAAIRHASALLEKQNSQQKLLLLLTDGKPNDLDVYEGRYGIEDTRHAISEARQKGQQVFCVTIDEKANDYLPHIFGTRSYVVIRKADELPRELPLLYAKLTGC
ncbi:MAG: nitric oxide reductase NorD protein [Pseudomonadota bacterium]|nr:nitric oxide reductase NorD protein [Pseudomonadota bacterium]